MELVQIFSPSSSSGLASHVVFLGTLLAPASSIRSIFDIASVLGKFGKFYVVIVVKFLQDEDVDVVVASFDEAVDQVMMVVDTDSTRRFSPQVFFER